MMFQMPEYHEPDFTEKKFTEAPDAVLETVSIKGVAPGGVITDIPLVMPAANEFGFSRASKLLDFSPELGMPEDIANAALFSASDESKFVNGVILTCDGGWTNL